ncbi:hypothetical protein OAG36_01170 [bacterium]|nr:hypothetical protein [bacterium]
MPQEIGQGIGLESWLDPVKLEESRQEAIGFNIAPEDADIAIEKAFFDAAPEQRVAAGTENMNEPAKAPALNEAIEQAKGANVKPGPGIVQAIFAGLAGAFSEPGQGVKVATGLLDKWDPRNQEAKRVEREGAAGKVADEATVRQREKDQNDPESSTSKNLAGFYMEKFKSMPSMAAQFEGKSAVQIQQMADSLSPELKKALGADELEAKRQATAATRENTQAYREATLEQGQARIDAAKRKEEEAKRKQDEKERIDREGRKAGYETELTSAAATITMFKDALAKLEKGEVATGPILEFFAPVGAGEREQSGMLANMMGSVRQSLNPEVEIINQVQARLNAEAKKLYDLGVMSRDDWSQMEKMSIGPGFDEAQNIKILNDQLNIVRKSRGKTEQRLAAEGGSAAAAEGGSAAPQDDMVSVLSPNGKKGKIPRSKLKGALAAGYQEI